MGTETGAESFSEPELVSWPCSCVQVEMLECGNQSMEVRRKAAYRCLVPYWMQLCVLRPCSQKMTLSLQCESQILGSKTAANVAITMLVTESECGQTQTKTYGEWANHVGSMLLILLWQWCRCKCCHSSSPRIFTNGSTSYEMTPETLANSHHSLGMRPRKDYTDSVMLNDCVSC